MNREGFWRSSYEPVGRNDNLPWPNQDNTVWHGKKAFLEKLESIEAVAKTVHYRGFSICRLCGCINETAEFETKQWTWPAGYKHYIEAHNVRPSLAFEEWVTEEKVT